MNISALLGLIGLIFEGLMKDLHFKSFQFFILTRSFRSFGRAIYSEARLGAWTALLGTLAIEISDQIGFWRERQS